MLCLASLGVCLVLLLSGCPTHQALKPGTTDLFAPGERTVLLMPIDVELYELSVGGLPELRADWTEAANRYVLAALRKETSQRGLSMVELDESGLDFAQRQELRQIVKLHEAVGSSMLQHQRSRGWRLSSKESVSDWTMGDSVELLHDRTDARYAMFLYLRDSYITAGRMALNVVTTILFGTGVSGTQIGYVTLVDLDTGQVAWFSSVVDTGSGDLRTQEAADKAIDLLLGELPGS